MDQDPGLEDDQSLVEVKYLEGSQLCGQGLFDRGKRQWSVKETISLIEAYRVHPNLWNQEDPEYKNREKKYDSLKEIAVLFGTNVYEIERKIKNINCQYRRERRSYNISTRASTSNIFKPKWFGYAGMSFLHDRFRKSSLMCENLSVVRQSLEDRSREIEAQFRAEQPREPPRFVVREQQNEQHRLAIRDQQSEQREQQQRLIREQQNEQREQSRFLYGEQAKEKPQLDEEKQWRDEYDIFGELVAHKVRNLRTEASKATVQHLINNVLFCAQMGKYDYSQLSSFASGDISLCTSPQIDIAYREAASMNDTM